MVTILVRDRVFDRKESRTGLCLQAKNISFTFVLYRLQECQGGCSFRINCYGKARRTLWIITICDTKDGTIISLHKINRVILTIISQPHQRGLNKLCRLT